MYVELLLMCDFKRIGVAHSIRVIGLHLLRAVVRLQPEVWIEASLRLKVPFADWSRLEGGFVISLQVHIIDLTLELHRKRSGRSCVHKARSVA